MGTDDEHGCQLLERFLARPEDCTGDRQRGVDFDGPGELGQEASATILKLCERLGKAGGTRLIFTSREALPAPFDKNVLADRPAGPGYRDPPPGQPVARRAEVGRDRGRSRNLVEAVGGHARSLVLIAREVGAAGVRHATENLRRSDAGDRGQASGREGELGTGQRRVVAAPVAGGDAAIDTAFECIPRGRKIPELAGQAIC